MLRNFITIAIRNILKDRVYAAINIAGLALGLASSVFLFIYVVNELTYDRYHSKHERIYRIVFNAKLNDELINTVYTSSALGATMQAEFPEIEHFVRFFALGNRAIFHHHQITYEDKFCYTDSTLFDVFDIPLKYGNHKTALIEPYSLVISESMAKKYFGNANPLDQTLVIRNNVSQKSDFDTATFKITGVFADIPSNSHFHFDFFASITTLNFFINEKLYLANNTRTYLLLKPNTDAKALEKKFDGLVKKYIIPQMEKAFENAMSGIMSTGYWRYTLQELKDIHLRSQLMGEFEANGDIGYIYLFASVAVAIILLACINFVNLSTAQSVKRAKEVGIRKMVGSHRKLLIGQFLVESIILSFIALQIAMVIVEVGLPFFENIAGCKIMVNYTQYFWYWLAIPAIALLVGLAAGFYPAIVLSKFNPIEVVKGKFARSPYGKYLRNGLVVFQFAVATIIILGMIVVYKQLQYIQNKELGFDKEHVLVIERTFPLKSSMESFIAEINEIPNIKSAALTADIIGRQTSSAGFVFHAKEGEKTVVCTFSSSHSGYAEALGIDLVAGRFFSADYNDTTRIIVNEAAVKAFGIKDPIGAIISTPNPVLKGEKKSFTIIGVINNFHYESLREPIRPYIMFNIKSYFDGYVVVRMSGDISANLKQLEKVWNRFAPEHKMQYFFFDQEFEHFYKSELATMKLLSIFSFLSVFIALLGLFGLVSYSVTRRTREIGIRKTLGATPRDIIRLVSFDMIKPILLAKLIGIPVAWILLTTWLNNFAYHIKINPVWVVWVVAITLLTGFVTILWQAYTASQLNPGYSVKIE